MKETEEIKERARKIMGNISLNTLTTEHEIVKELDTLINEPIKDIEQAEKKVAQYELYFYIKEKMLKAEENFNYLKDIADELRTQEIRYNDVKEGIPLFKVNKGEKMYYFLTRDKAQSFSRANKLEDKNIIKIEESTIQSIKNIIETIQKNF